MSLEFFLFNRVRFVICQCRRHLSLLLIPVYCSPLHHLPRKQKLGPSLYSVYISGQRNLKVGPGWWRKKMVAFWSAEVGPNKGQAKPTKASLCETVLILSSLIRRSRLNCDTLKCSNHLGKVIQNIKIIKKKENGTRNIYHYILYF